MSWRKALTRAFQNAPVLNLDSGSRYVFISDCHRGNGTSNDNFLKYQHLFFAALMHYYDQGYTYLELGDGDELWENRSMSQITEIHSNVFWLMSRFFQSGRLYLLYGNHDMVKASEDFAPKYCSTYYCTETCQLAPLMPGLTFYESVIIRDKDSGRDICLTHGHQADPLNSSFWKMARFLVRYLWKPLERIGFLDPTSAAKNNFKKDALEKRLTNWAVENNCFLIAGHTHRPMLDIKTETPYLNTGSCVHPRCITAIELNDRCFTLVKWNLCIRDDFSLFICREQLAGPVCIDDFYS